MAEPKPCAVCGRPFSSPDPRKRMCSRACIARARSKSSIVQRWERQRARAAARPAERLPRDDEEAAIAAFVAAGRVTRAAPVNSELIQTRQEMNRPYPMAGWRG